jgi:probable F420-dependent oxidoreductase
VNESEGIRLNEEESHERDSRSYQSLPRARPCSGRADALEHGQTGPVTTTAAPRFPELGFYTLAGGAQDPRALLTECADAEALGLGAVFISERFNVKEAVTLSGAAAAATTSMKIITGATNHNTRHPIVSASYATTMHRLTRGRFVLGIGRGIAPLFDAYGLPRITTAQMEEFASVMRRLWHGETIIGHDGEIGSYPALRLDRTFDEDIPLGLVAFGPNSLELGGRAFDHVILHTFFTDETLMRCVRTVKDAAERAGRDPDSVTVWSCYATVGDHLDEPTRLLKTVGRLATYLQAYGDLMVTTNRWDPAVLERFRADEVVRTIGGAIDVVATTAQLEHVATLLPPEWLAPAATGTPEQCAAAVRGQLELGADAVIMHGASPAELAPIVRAYAST